MSGRDHDSRERPSDITPPEISFPDATKKRTHQCPHYADASMDGKCYCRDECSEYVRSPIDPTSGRCPDCGHAVSLIKLPSP